MPTVAWNCCSHCEAKPGAHFAKSDLFGLLAAVFGTLFCGRNSLVSDRRSAGMASVAAFFVPVLDAASGPELFLCRRERHHSLVVLLETRGTADVGWFVLVVSWFLLF